ncbi:MAG: MFS transporter [Hyphomonadaceae bacterium]|nr:MFS transporter [Hyphomonadaceae bacterium]
MESRTASMLALAGVVLIGMTGFGVFLPIFPFLALDLGATPTATTIAMGAYSFGQLIASPLWGRLSDRIGRKAILIAGLIGGVVSYLWIAHASTVYDLGAARLFGGLMAGNVGAAFAAAADLADDKTRARNMGILGAAVGFGFIAGPAFGAFLIGHEPTRESFVTVCYASAGLAALAALAAVVFFRESLTPESRTQKGEIRASRLTLLTSRASLLRFVVVMFLTIAAQALMETTFGLWADAELKWGPREVGWTLAALGVGAVLLQGGGAGRAARILGERMTLLIGLALFAAGFAGLAVSHTAQTMAASLTALVIGIGLATPALNALIAAQAAEGERGEVMGLSQSASALGRVAGPLGAGVLFDQLGSGAPFAVAAVLIIAALFVTLGEPSKDAFGHAR